MNKHTSYDLAQMQSLPLEAKVRMTQQRIRQWYESWSKYEIYNEKTGKTKFVTSDQEPTLKDHECILSAVDGQVYVSFSGGKDSTVLKHIVDSMYSDVPAVFVNTGLEYPEIQKFAMSQKNVVVIRPEMRFDEVIKNYGYPVATKEVAWGIRYAKKTGTKSSDYYLKKFNGELMFNGEKSKYTMEKWKFLLDADFNVDSSCCDVMKKRPTKKYTKETGRKPIMGTMASESRLRYQKWIQNGCNAFDVKNPASQPLSFWTEQDILQYIKQYNVPYCSVYGDIIEEDGVLKMTQCNRTGCIFCMFGCHLEKEPNRFQRLKETHPRQYEYCIGGGEMVDGKWQPSKEGLGLAHVLDYIGVKYD